MRRREVLTISTASLGGLLINSLDGKFSRLSAEDKPIRIPIRFFAETEALIVSAAVSRIFPSDDSRPGAREAGVAIYIDRQLACPYGGDRYRYIKSHPPTSSPFSVATPSRACFQIQSTVETSA